MTFGEVGESGGGVPAGRLKANRSWRHRPQRRRSNSGVVSEHGDKAGGGKRCTPKMPDAPAILFLTGLTTQEQFQVDRTRKKARQQPYDHGMSSSCSSRCPAAIVNAKTGMGGSILTVLMLDAGLGGQRGRPQDAAAQQGQARHQISYRPLGGTDYEDELAGYRALRVGWLSTAGCMQMARVRLLEAIGIDQKSNQDLAMSASGML